MKKYVKAAKSTVKDDYFFPIKKKLDDAIMEALDLEFAKRGIDEDIADKAKKVAEIIHSVRKQIESIER